MSASFGDDCEVAVIGAGPYGLAVAAHLNAAQITTRVLGQPLSFWRDNMPKGMKLRSPSIASNIADPQRKFTLDAFAHQHGINPVKDQLPREQFVSYGDWFQRQVVPDADTRKAIRIEHINRGFCIALEDGEVIRAQRIVVAMGLAGQDVRPTPCMELPKELVSHTCEHASLEKWRGRRVAVVGRGQSACESAALLREAGSDVDLICRGTIRWLGASQSEQAHDRGWLWRARECLQAPSAVGPPPWNWLNELPGIERRLPAALRSRISIRSLRPAAAGWVKPRFAGVRIRAGAEITGAVPKGDQIAVRIGSALHIYDHVLLATGYKTNIAKYRILSDALMQKIACTDGSPNLAAGFESTVPGLHFVGSSAVGSFGPLMRFIAGSGYAARSVTRAVLADRSGVKRKSLIEMDRNPLTGRLEDMRILRPRNAA